MVYSPSTNLLRFYVNGEHILTGVPSLSLNVIDGVMGQNYNEAYTINYEAANLFSIKYLTLLVVTAQDNIVGTGLSVEYKNSKVYIHYYYLTMLHVSVRSPTTVTQETILNFVYDSNSHMCVSEDIMGVSVGTWVYLYNATSLNVIISFDLGSIVTEIYCLNDYAYIYTQSLVIYQYDATFKLFYQN